MSTLRSVGPVMPHSASTHLSTLSIGCGWSWPQKGAFQVNHTQCCHNEGKNKTLLPDTPWKLLETLEVQFCWRSGASNPYTASLHPWSACSCGRRLCEETTGRCLCPPQTIRPQCDMCEVHSFSFHPLAGCEGCNCSRTGTDGTTTPECDRDHGQCR